MDDRRRCSTSFQGNGTSCDPNACAQPVPGACCTDENVCERRSNVSCQGRFMGADSRCMPADLCASTAPGVCCDNSGGCAELSPADCGGRFLGQGLSCDGEPCQGEAGACCDGDGSCTDGREVTCANAMGFFYLGAMCSDAPCNVADMNAPPPVGDAAAPMSDASVDAGQ